MQYYRRNLYVLSFSMFLASASWFQVMPFLPLFLKDLGVKGNLLQWAGYIFSIQSLASIVALPYWGKLGDRYGRKTMTLRAGFFLSSIYFGMSVCQTPYQLAVLRFLNGALTGFIPGAMAIIATNTPKALAPRYVATAQTAHATGQIIGPALGGVLAAALGYRGSMTASGCAVLVSTLLVLFFVREENRAHEPDQTRLWDDFVFALRSPVLASIMVVVGVNSFFMSSVNPLLAIHLAHIGVGAPEWLTGVVFSLPAIAFVLSAHRWTLLGEARGYQYAVQVGLICAAVCAMILGALRSIWFFAPAFFLMGLCIAVVNPSTGAIICTRVPDSFRGRAYAMQSSALMLGALIAPLVATQSAAALGIPSVFVGIGLIYLGGVAVFRSLARRWEAVPVDEAPAAQARPENTPLRTPRA